MIVKLKATVSQYGDLSEGQLYFVIGIEADDYRIINDSGKPYLYPANIFTVSDSGEPQDWVTNYGEDGERYSYPSQLNDPGFFEDVFDHKPEQTSIFWHNVSQRLAEAA